MIDVWDNESEAARCVNTRRPLTRLLDSTERGLAVKATRTCSVAGCDRTHFGRRLCRMHYERVRRSGSPDRQPFVPSLCAVGGCSRVVRGLGLCNKHYQRLNRTGTTERRPFKPSLCAVDGCDRVILARGWCGLHYERWRNNGDPLTVRPNPAMLPGERNCKWQHDEIGYTAAHDRVKAKRGSASDHPCADCGKPAVQWAYDHKDSDERVEPDDPKSKPYSVKPEHYRPLCIECHWRVDHPTGRRTRG